MTTDYKVTELFCIKDEFCKHFDAENAGNLLEDNSGTKRRRRQASLSDSEIMTILLYFHFGTFRNFKHYYLSFIKGTMKSYFPKAPRLRKNMSWKNTRLSNSTKRLYDTAFGKYDFIVPLMKNR